MRYLIGLLLLFSLNTSAQTGVLGLLRNTPDPVPLLIVFGGESNSGGLARNADATTAELAPRTLKILNNTTLTSFDALDVGTNNLIGHTGLQYAKDTAHGWEIGLADAYEAGVFGGRAVYLVKAGQGGTTIAQWADEATYTAEGTTVEPFDVLIARVQAAMSLIEAETGQTPEVVMWWSQGINDSGYPTDPAVWKAATKNVLTAIRTTLGLTLPICIMRFEFMPTNPYATQIDEIAAELSSIAVISTSGMESIGDVYHLNYASMKAWALAAVNARL